MIQLFNWFRRRSLERGLDRELQYHFDRPLGSIPPLMCAVPRAGKAPDWILQERSAGQS
jgi:hypothetical protein